jgi:hypothetical protein
MKLKNRIQGKQNQKQGHFGEQYAERWLYSQRFKCIEPVETGWRVKFINGKVVSAHPKAKVGGDFTCIGLGGQAVYVEVKTEGGDRLVHSKLEEHQAERMDAKTKAGALCLLIWVKSPTELKALQWPIPNFVKGSSLKWEDIR